MYCEWPQLHRCCFCMPLRRGVLLIAYIKFFFCAFMVGVYSYAVHEDLGTELVYQGSYAYLPGEMCTLIYCVDCLFTACLIYGAHKKIMKPVKYYYFFSICTLMTTLMLQIVEVVNARHEKLVIELVVMCLAGLGLQLYALTLVRSLMKKLEVYEPHDCENQLHIENGQVKVESKGIFNPNTIPTEV